MNNRPVNKRPVIGVTGPTEGGMFAWAMTWLALRRTGAKPVRITSKTDTVGFRLDGLVIGGGSDIDPDNYGEELLQLKKPEQSFPEHPFKDKLLGILLFVFRVIFSIKMSYPKIDTDRDALEKKLCLYALENNLPVLGICRGAQLINTSLAGTLYQDTRFFYSETPHIRSILPRKSIYLKKNSKIREILGTDHCLVNSLHDQAIKDPGHDIRITARETNKMVQAIEHEKHRFMIGVQWHPEYLPQIKVQQRLFQSLTDAARKTRQ